MTAPATPPDLPEDRRQHREWLLALADLPERGVVIDLGCGKGEDLCLLARQHPHTDLRFIGLDASDTSLGVATTRAAGDPRLSFQQARLDARLPFPDGSVDLVYSHNVLECLEAPSTCAVEVARIVRPGGQVVIGHWDRDSQTFDGTDKALLRRLVHAYAGGQRRWMDHADAWMGRRLWGGFNATGAFGRRAS